MNIIVNKRDAEQGQQGQKYLVKGDSLSMRLWSEELDGGERKPERSRDYETLGYVIKGQAELIVEGRSVLLEPGDSWVVPRNASHTYRILEPFVAVEATHPPARDSE